MNGSSTPTTASRAAITATSHHGIIPRAAIPMRVTAMNRRSAAGSRNRPSREVWWKRRAITPSTQSLAAEATSTMTAATSRPVRISTSTTGTISSRTKEITFGIVKMRVDTSSGAPDPCSATAQA